LDFVLAYTQADIERDLYMKLPAGFTVPGRTITEQDNAGDALQHTDFHSPEWTLVRNRCTLKNKVTNISHSDFGICKQFQGGKLTLRSLPKKTNQLTL
jgi:hypothetical protein